MKFADRWAKQSGTSLMEVLVAMSISLVVTASMVALMSNSLANTTRIIQMTKLTDNLRIALLLMSVSSTRQCNSPHSVADLRAVVDGTNGSANTGSNINSIQPTVPRRHISVWCLF